MKVLQKKEGYTTILFMIVASIVLPFGLFFFVEMKHAHNLKDGVQDLVQNASEAALWHLENEELANGKIVLQEEAAQVIVDEVLATGWNREASKSLPSAEVFVFNQDSIGLTNTSPEGRNFDIKHPTVGVRTAFQAKGIFFSKFDDVKNENYSYITWREPQEVIPVAGDNQKVNIDTLRIVNPQSYPEQEGFPVRNADPFKLFGHSYIDLEINEGEDFVIDSGMMSLQFSDSDIPVISRQVAPGGDAYTFYLPETLKDGTQVTLQATSYGYDTSLEDSMLEELQVTVPYGTITGHTKNYLQIQRLIGEK